MMKRIKAFTLIEVTVVMLLSSILITMAFMVYGQTARSYQKIKAGSEKSAARLQLQYLLFNDCSKVTSATLTGNRFAVRRSDNRDITYLMLEGQIIREDISIKDTFFIDPYEITVKHSFENPELVEKISLVFSGSENSIEAFVRYSSQVKFNNQQN